MIRFQFRAVALSASLAGAAVALTGGIAAAQAAMPSVVPHRAVYDLQLDPDRTANVSGDIRGRLVFEAIGNACEGYTVNTRFVTEIVSPRGGLVNDLRSATWESGDGSSYRFITRNFRNDELEDETDGAAVRADDGIAIDLKVPEEATFSLGSEVLFPTQHARHVLDAALSGETIFLADIYDGSDTGRKTYNTTTVIGARRPPAPDTHGVGDAVLGTLASWPVTVGYFDPAGEEPDTPAYEFSYDLYENGVSTRIVLDYGDFALTGDLARIEFLDDEPCEQ